MNDKRGFTVTELAIVCFVMAVLGAAVTSAYGQLIGAFFGTLGVFALIARFVPEKARKPVVFAGLVAAFVALVLTWRSVAGNPNSDIGRMLEKARAAKAKGQAQP